VLPKGWLVVGGASTRAGGKFLPRAVEHFLWQKMSWQAPVSAAQEMNGKSRALDNLNIGWRRRRLVKTQSTYAKLERSAQSPEVHGTRKIRSAFAPPPRKSVTSQQPPKSARICDHNISVCDNSDQNSANTCA